jgi:hypothetical protein
LPIDAGVYDGVPRRLEQGDTNEALGEREISAIINHSRQPIAFSQFE